MDIASAIGWTRSEGMEAEGGEGAREFMAMLEIFRCRMYTRIIRNQLQAAVTLFSETACCQIMTAVGVRRRSSISEIGGHPILFYVTSRAWNNRADTVLCNCKRRRTQSRLTCTVTASRVIHVAVLA
jgi:hypothetical protein